jgi:hypothetical protein
MVEAKKKKVAEIDDARVQQAVAQDFKGKVILCKLII